MPRRVQGESFWNARIVRRLGWVSRLDEQKCKEWPGACTDNVLFHILLFLFCLSYLSCPPENSIVHQNFMHCSIFTFSNRNSLSHSLVLCPVLTQRARHFHVREKIDKFSESSSSISHSLCLSFLFQLIRLLLCSSIHFPSTATLCHSNICLSVTNFVL